MLLPLMASAQFMVSVNVSPLPALTCSTITVTLVGSKGCLNGVLNGTTSSVVGSNIFVSLDVSQPFICLPVITNITGSVNLTGTPPGNYTLHAQYVENGIVTNTITQPLVIGSCCTVNTNIVASALGTCVGGSLQFSAASSSLISPVWKLDGTQIATGLSATQSFPNPGTYTISLIGEGGGCLDSTSQTITIVNDPMITFPLAVNEGCPGKMDGSITTNVTLGQAPYQYSWGNGSTSSTLSGVAAGTYVLTVTDAFGCMGVDSATISAGPPIFGSFLTSDTLICPGDTVSFTNTSQGNAASLWYEDGVLISATTDLLLSFPLSGSYEIKLLAVSATCEDSVFQTIEVSSAPAFSSQLTQPSCPSASDGAIDLTATSSFGPLSFLWSTGATSEDLTQIPAGTYLVTATDIAGCTWMDTTTLSAAAGIVANFTASDTGIVCLGDMVTFTANNPGAISFEWLANGSAFGSSASSSYTFSDTGNISISYLVADGTCVDTASLMITVGALPLANASITDELCPNGANGSIDLSPSLGYAPYTFSWSNGQTSEDLASLSAGTYIVTITDREMCQSKDTLTVLTLGGIVADFDYTYGPSGIQFNDLSTDPVSWLWDFGDGTTSTDQNPLHLFQASGTYEVCFKAIDSFGCVDNICQLVSFSVGIDQELIGQLKLFPNPTQGLTHIDLTDWSGQKVSITVLDMVGKEVIHTEATASDRLQLDLSSLSSGSYTVLLRINGKYLTGRMWKE